MDIGTEEPAIIIEPIEDPMPNREPVKPERAPEPVRETEPEPDLVPA